MIEKLTSLWPEIAILSGACICMLLGLSSNVSVRRVTVWVAVAALVVAGSFASGFGPGAQVSSMAQFIKLAVAIVGLLLLMVAAGLPDRLQMTVQAEASATRGGAFEPADAMRGEFYALFLFSLAGLMLCAGADDLVWLFLALELTSLPTYVMVAISRDRVEAQESAVKYFFLGAMATGMFLYGFALIYGATGETNFAAIQASLGDQENSNLLTLGMVLALIGLAFKIAAVPMHFYVADVYEGANVSVSAFLAFVPKAAGFVSIILLLSLFGGPLPHNIYWLIWIMAAVTMTVGNVLGLCQYNVKRVLAYSSVAHTGYMLVPLIAGTAAVAGGGGVSDHGMLDNAVAAVLFYLVAYALATMGAFAVLGCLQQGGQEAQSYDDIAGLVRREPLLGGIMLLSVLSLIGLPPMVGFLGKIYLFGTALSTGESSAVWLVVVAVINTAISAVYYLRIVSACFFGRSPIAAQPLSAPARRLGAAVAVIASLVLGVAGGGLVDAAAKAGNLHILDSVPASFAPEGPQPVDRTVSVEDLP